MSLKWKIAQHLEIRWWKRYLKSKSPKEYLEWKNNYWKGFLKKINIEVANGASILDAGCGPAGIFVHFPNHQVSAVDPLLEQYETLPHFSSKKYPNTTFQNASLETAKLAQYDYIFCLNAINHVADLPKSFDKIVGALKPNGKMIVSIDAHNYKGLKHLFRLLPGDVLHPHQYDKEEYKNMLTQRGLTIDFEILIKHEIIFDYWALVASKKD